MRCGSPPPNSAGCTLDGARRHTGRVPSRPAAASVVIDPGETFPYIDRSNQRGWR
ncbi:MAG TPA: hypothetical protein VF041_05860 [Gemmatimonadaceae bacterium]